MYLPTAAPAIERNSRLRLFPCHKGTYLPTYVARDIPRMEFIIAIANKVITPRLVIIMKSPITGEGRVRVLRRRGWRGRGERCERTGGEGRGGPVTLSKTSGNSISGRN